MTPKIPRAQLCSGRGSSHDGREHTLRLWLRPASYLPQPTGGLLSVLLSSSSRAAASTQKCSATHRKGPANARLHSCAASGLPNRSPSRASFEAERKPCEERREGRAVNAYGGDIVVVAMRDPSHAGRDLHPQFTGFHAGGQQWGCPRRLTPWHSRGAPAHPPVLGCAPSSFPDGQGVSPCLAWLRQGRHRASGPSGKPTGKVDVCNVFQGAVCDLR